MQKLARTNLQGNQFTGQHLKASFHIFFKYTLLNLYALIYAVVAKIATRIRACTKISIPTSGL